jgi:hypothetical protein
MKQNKRNSKKEKENSKQTGNENELKTGKNDSPDYNGVGVNEDADLNAPDVDTDKIEKSSVQKKEEQEKSS